MKKIVKNILKIIAAVFIFLNIVVIFHAYKFTHFYNIGEVEVKQQEDKTSWDKTKEMLFGFNAVKQANSQPDTVFQKVMLTTKDNLHLEGWWIPVANARGTVLMFHGHGGKKSGNNLEAAAFRKMGYNTFQLDFRAHGNSEGNSCTIGYYESEDVKLAYDFIKEKGEKNMVLWGISMGASTITKAINDFGIAPQKIILEMPFGTLSDAVVGRVKMMHLPAQPISALLTFWGGIEHGFWAYNFKPEDYAKKISCPTLLQWGAHDPRVSKSEEEILFANLNTDNKKFVVYKDSKHESLCQKENGKWVEEVSGFLNK